MKEMGQRNTEVVEREPGLAVSTDVGELKGPGRDNGFLKGHSFRRELLKVSSVPLGDYL